MDMTYKMPSQRMVLPNRSETHRATVGLDIDIIGLVSCQATNRVISVRNTSDCSTTRTLSKSGRAIFKEYVFANVLSFQEIKVWKYWHSTRNHMDRTNR